MLGFNTKMCTILSIESTILSPLVIAVMLGDATVATTIAATLTAAVTVTVTATVTATVTTTVTARFVQTSLAFSELLLF